MYKYTYTVGVLYALSLWALFYRLASRSRKVMRWGGYLAIWMGPLYEYLYRRDYWQPEYLLPIQWGSWTFGLEDIIVSFVLGSGAAGIFDLLVRRWGERELVTINAQGAARFLLVLLSGFVATSLLVALFQVNSLYATLIATAGLSLWVFSRRRRWLPAALITGLVCGISSLVFYGVFYFPLFPGVLERGWVASALSGLMVLGVPVEELIYTFISSLFYGPAFRYCQDHGN
jgi:hypothetical protein